MNSNDTDLTTLKEAADGAMKVMEDSLGAAKKACEERDSALEKVKAAEAKAKAAEDKVVELEKVAADIGTSLAGLADIFVEAGIWDDIDRREKAASLIDDPEEAPRLVRNLLKFSAGPSGSGYPKTASSDGSDDPASELREEREAWAKMAKEGAAG